MDPAAGFLDAILADPGDDTPRLVYADWLEEYGQAERGEFIRVQCELARHEAPKHPGVVACEGKGPPARAGGRKRCKCRPCALCRRERELAAPRRLHEWLGPRPGLATWVGAWPEDVGWLAKKPGEGAVAIRAAFRRGFVEAVELPLADFLRHAGALFACQPVEEVRLSDKRPQEFTSRGYWRWFDGSELDDAGGIYDPPDASHDELPYALWRAYDRLTREAEHEWEHPTLDDALLWLSRAAVALGRDEARKLRREVAHAP